PWITHRDDLIGERSHIHRPAIAERLNGTGEVLRLLRIVGRGAEHVERILSGELWHVDDFEPRRPIAQQPNRSRRVTAREDEPVPAGGQSLDELVQNAAQAWEALERAQLEEFIEQERRGIAAHRAATPQKRERRVER